MSTPADGKGDGRFRHSDITGIDTVSPSQSKDLRSEFDALKKERDGLIQRESIVSEKLDMAMKSKNEMNKNGQSVAVLEKDLKSARMDIEKFKAQSRETAEQLAELEVEHAQLQGELEKMAEELTKEKATVQSLKKDLDAKREQVNATTKRQQETTEQLAAKNDAINNLKEEAKKSNEENQQLKAEIGTLQQHIKAQHGDLEKVRKQMVSGLENSAATIQKKEQELFCQDEMQFYDVVMDFDFMSGTVKEGEDQEEADSQADQGQASEGTKEPEHDGFPLKYRIPDPNEETNNDKPLFVKEGIAVPVIGACTKGKTWLLSSLTGTDLRSSTSVCTRGLSICYTKVEERTLALLDTAGTGAPVRADKEKDIFFRETAEQLLREAAIAAGGKLFIFVVGDITAPEQLQLRRLRSEMLSVNSNFRVIVVHNLRDECTWTGMKEKYERLRDYTLKGSQCMTQDVLGVGARTAKQQKEGWIPEDEKAMWLQNSDAQVQHYLIGRAGTDAARRNEANFTHIQRILLAEARQLTCDNMIERVLISLSKSAKNFYSPEPAFVFSDTEQTEYFMTVQDSTKGKYLGLSLEEARQNAPKNSDPNRIFYCQTYVKPIPKWLKNEQNRAKLSAAGKKWKENDPEFVDLNPEKSLPSKCSFKEEQLERAGNYHVFKSQVGGEGERLIKAYHTNTDHITMFIDFPGAVEQPDVYLEDKDGLQVLTFSAERPNPIKEGSGFTPLNTDVAEVFRRDCGKLTQTIELRGLDDNMDKWDEEWENNVYILTIPMKNKNRRRLEKNKKKGAGGGARQPGGAQAGEPEPVTKAKEQPALVTVLKEGDEGFHQTKEGDEDFQQTKEGDEGEYELVPTTGTENIKPSL